MMHLMDLDPGLMHPGEKLHWAAFSPYPRASLWVLAVI
jgi:hypothetical protein